MSTVDWIVDDQLLKKLVFQGLNSYGNNHDCSLMDTEDEQEIDQKNEDETIEITQTQTKKSMQQPQKGPFKQLPSDVHRNHIHSNNPPSINQNTPEVQESDSIDKE